MAEARSQSILVNLEPSVRRVLSSLLGQTGQSASSYCRHLIIRDLRQRGVLPDKLAAEIFSGESFNNVPEV